MSYKRKFTKEAIALIEQYGKELKPLAKYDPTGRALYKKEVVDGIVLLQSGQLDANGRPGVPGTKYVVPVLQYANHIEEMQNAYRAGGIEAVEEYALFVRRKRAENEAYVASRVRKSWLSRVKSWLGL